MALFDSQLTWLANIGGNHLNAGEPPRGWGNAHPSIVPYQVFRDRDGRHFLVAIGTELLWSRFTRVLGAEEALGRDARFASNALRIKHRRRADPLAATDPGAMPGSDLAGAHGQGADSRRHSDRRRGAQGSTGAGTRSYCVCGLIVSIEHPAIGIARSIANPIRLSATPPLYRLPPPLLGEHTAAILQELQCSPEEIAAARKNSAI